MSSARTLLSESILDQTEMAVDNADSYKLSHKGFMEELTTRIYSNFTARSWKHLPVIKERFDGKAVFFGLQHFCLEYLIDSWNRNFFNQPKEIACGEFKEELDEYLGKDAVDVSHFEALWELGYLPIEIKALPEGARVNIKVPFWTIQNTHDDFAWLTNYLETVASCESWKPITTATIIYEFRKLINEYAMLTTGSLDFTDYQAHDFCFRGMSNRQDAAACGAGFLLSSRGTDTTPAIRFLKKYYYALKDFIGTSVPASEHSIACAGTAVKGELESYRKWITKDYPTGIVSLVSDTYDYFRVIQEFLPLLKEDILARPANELGFSKTVLRPDSGIPQLIIAGYRWDGVDHLTEADAFDSSQALSRTKQYNVEVVKVKGIFYLIEDSFGGGVHLGKVLSEAEVKGSIELMWEIFGGTITPKNFKLLDSHIGLIYGDSITLPIMLETFERLREKGFASTNVVFGIGSYTMQYVTRDSLGIAVKATYTVVDGVGYELFKDPVTDDGTKKSAKGLLRVELENGDYVLYDQQTPEQERMGELKTVFLNSKMVREHTLTEMRDRLWPVAA
jgi:nicotinamide phosphoribosyltransferase